MHYFIFPEKDTTIYEDHPTQNAGLDQILEIEKQLVYGAADVPSNSRILIKFNLDDFSSSFASGELSGSDMKFYLNLWTDEAIEIPLSYTLYAYPISQSWEMGIGKRGNNPRTTEGASWNLRDGITISGVSGSSWVNSGSDYITGSIYTATQSFSYQTSDIQMDITNMVMGWLSGSLPNHGLIIKRSDGDEQSVLNQGTIQFFSKETHTIYRPRIDVIWKDSVINPYSSSVSSSIETAITVHSWSVDDVTSYATMSYYTASLPGYVTASGDNTTWYSQSIVGVTESIYRYTSSLGLYFSSSFYTSSTYSDFVYTSGSDTRTSRSIDTTTITYVPHYTASLGTHFTESVPNIFWSSGSITASYDVWTYDTTTGVYVSQSYTPVTSSYTYLSSSVSSSASSSVNTYQTIYPIQSEEYVMYLSNLQYEYRQNSRIKFRVNTRERYPRKTFVTQSWAYTRDKYSLPTSSYYSIRDAWTDEEWMPFSEYTKLSVDQSGSYFNLYLQGLEPERLYRILIKSIQNGIEDIYDNESIFKIIR